MPATVNPRATAARTTARVAAFIPGACQPFIRRYMSESRSKLPRTILSAVIGEGISMSAQNLKITAPAPTPSDKQTLVPDATILWLDQAGATDVNRVGGKNAGLRSEEHTSELQS